MRKSTQENIEALTDASFCNLMFDSLFWLIELDPAYLKVSKFFSDSYILKSCRKESSLLKPSAAEKLEGLRRVYPRLEQLIAQYDIAS